MTDKLPYTHWAYFTDRSAAEACARELDDRFDCLIAVDPAYQAPEYVDLGEWLLRAARTVSLDWPGGWHDEIAEVVERHGGNYDGGEACMFVKPAEGRNDA